MSRMKLQLTSADIPHAIDRINSWGITIYDCVITSDISAEFFIDTSSYEQVVQMERYGCQIRILRDVRISYMDLMGKRWVLILGVTAILLLTMIIPTKVLFFRVEGNNLLPENLILEKAEECGIVFGASRREVRSEQVKNQLLQLMPQLQWAGINTQGCVAVISVRERNPEEAVQHISGIGNIVASRDGIIQSVTVVQGNSLCKPGQAVQEGEILISGYTDCGNMIRAEEAQGEVYAMTNRSITVIAPRDALKKSRIISDEIKYSLLIGKKRINLYKGSGILDGTCDKMYLYSYVTLPGGFQLPLALVRERWVIWQSESVVQQEDDAENFMKEFSDNHLLSQMVAGQILRSEHTTQHFTEYSVLSGSYACSEMIGQILYEERFQSNGENN